MRSMYAALSIDIIAPSARSPSIPSIESTSSTTRSNRAHTRATTWHNPWFSGTDTILDIGCGRGEFADRIVAKGCHVTGVDILPPNQVSPALDSYIQADLLRDGLSEVLTQLGSRKFD